MPIPRIHLSPLTITPSLFQEFIPRGRQSVESHPGPSNDAGKTPANGQLSTPLLTDNFLLHRLENISLTANDAAHNEFWHIREVFENIPAARGSSNDTSSSSSFLHPVYTNTEDELYVRGQTAVWSHGIPLNNDAAVPFKSFSVDSPIKFAFFCPRNYLRQNAKFRRFDAAHEKKSSFYAPADDEGDEMQGDRCRGICLVDATCLKTYLSDGEDFLTSLEFPVADIWPVRSCVLFERDATVTTIESRAIAMPRLFSQRHPLEEMSPVLIKYGDYLGYFANGEHRVIFCGETLDLVLLYDLKSGRHFIARLRKASEDEINYVAEASEQNSELFGNTTTSHLVPPGGSFYHSQRHNASVKRMHMTSVWQQGQQNPSKTTFHSGNSFHQGTATTPQGAANKSSARFLSPLVTSHLNPNHISRAVQSPLARLHSSIRHHSFSMQDARNYGQAEPAQPIYPEFCLETVWTEEIQVDRMLEPAARGFYHTDWIGQRYLCYLLPRQGRLYLIGMEGNGRSFGSVEMIEVKEAICLTVGFVFFIYFIQFIN